MRTKLCCDEINSIASSAVDEWLNELDPDKQYDLTTGHSLSYYERNGEWIWTRLASGGSAGELLYLEATKHSCGLPCEDATETRDALLAFLESLTGTAERM